MKKLLIIFLLASCASIPKFHKDEMLENNDPFYGKRVGEAEYYYYADSCKSLFYYYPIYMLYGKSTGENICVCELNLEPVND